MARDGGAAMRELIAAMNATWRAIEAKPGQRGVAGDLPSVARLGVAAAHLSIATDFLVTTLQHDRTMALAVASPYLTLVGTVAGGWLLAKSALAARRRRSASTGDDDYLSAKESVAWFYAGNLLQQAEALAQVVTSGGRSTLALTEDQF
jgi:hypothetical protein